MMRERGLADREPEGGAGALRSFRRLGELDHDVASQGIGQSQEDGAERHLVPLRMAVGVSHGCPFW